MNWLERRKIHSIIRGSNHIRKKKSSELRPQTFFIKVGGTPKGNILARYYGFNANISFTFQAIKNLFAHYAYLRSSFLKNVLVILRRF